MEAEMAKRGFVIVGWGDVGAAKVMSVGKAVVRPDDLKGMSAFVLPGDVVSPTFYTKVGAKSAPMSLGEVGSHLGKDVHILNISPYAAEQLQLASKVTHLTAYTTAFVIGAVILKKEKLDAMPAELREVVLRTGRARTEALSQTIRRQDGEAFGRLKKSKVTTTPTADDLKIWHDLMRDVRTSMRGAPFTPDVFDRIVTK
jgi:TRAP-type C4-dicarboxylate transport system substrate-binding protein